eukprot:COSAG02_NODE_4086_length_5806_cov_8.073243_5_plen_135_part_00
MSRERNTFLGWHRAALRLGDGSGAAHALLELSAHYDYAVDEVDTAQRHATAALRKLAVLAAGHLEAKPSSDTFIATATADEWVESGPKPHGCQPVEMAWAFYTRLWEADLVVPVSVVMAYVTLPWRPPLLQFFC